MAAWVMGCTGRPRLSPRLVHMVTRCTPGDGELTGPMARSIPFGVRFVRLLDGVDVSDPVAAAEGRAVFELLPKA